MKMTNESRLDRIIRVVVGIVLIVLAWGGTITGTLGIVSIALGIVLVVTGLIGFCPLYYLLKIRTNDK